MQFHNHNNHAYPAHKMCPPRDVHPVMQQRLAEYFNEPFASMIARMKRSPGKVQKKLHAKKSRQYFRREIMNEQAQASDAKLLETAD